MSDSGFHQDIATSHLPQHVKDALTKYNETHSPDTHGEYTQAEYSQMTYTWGFRYYRDSARGHMDASTWHTQLHTVHAESHLGRWLRGLAKAQGENPTPIAQITSY